MGKIVGVMNINRFTKEAQIKILFRTPCNIGAIPYEKEGRPERIIVRHLRKKPVGRLNETG